MIEGSLLVDYDRLRGAFERAGDQALRLLAAALAGSGLKIHSLTARVKPRESFRYKLSRPDRVYERLFDVTDVLGLRVTTYFDDEVEAVAKLVERTLTVDFTDSIDKRRSVDHAHFGYRSLHYVIRCDDRFAPTELVERGARFEIQIRTVLQHAWAEIEHDLAYKAAGAVPEAIRRRFSRVAGLLEIADEEFVSIRAELEAYSQEVARKLQDESAPVPLDGVSLATLAQSDAVARLDAWVAATLQKPLADEVFFPDYLLKMLRLAGMHDTAAVTRALAVHEDKARALVLPYFDFAKVAFALTARDLDRIYRGYGLFFLAHAAVLASGMLELSKVERFAAFYRELDYPDDLKTAQRVASCLVEVLKNV